MCPCAHTNQDNARALQFRGQTSERKRWLIYRGRVEVNHVMDRGSCKCFRYINSPGGAHLNLSGVTVNVALRNSPQCCHPYQYFYTVWKCLRSPGTDHCTYSLCSVAFSLPAFRDMLTLSSFISLSEFLIALSLSQTPSVMCHCLSLSNCLTLFTPALLTK